MTKSGHVLTGIGSLFITLDVCLQNQISPILPVIGVLLGTTAPDWLEVSWWNFLGNRKSLIMHRTLTHWWILWVVLFMLALFIKDTLEGMFTIGFCIGALTHLLFDLPNPHGIPMFMPYGKTISLNLWKSGKFEVILIPAWAILGFFVLMF